jgi:hypothetical protein
LVIQYELRSKKNTFTLSLFPAASPYLFSLFPPAVSKSFSAVFSSRTRWLTEVDRGKKPPVFGTASRFLPWWIKTLPRKPAAGFTAW